MPKTYEDYPLDVAEDLMKQAYDFLWANAFISFDTELRANLQAVNIIDAYTYRYLTEQKFPTELATYKKQIDDVLEFRKCKDKAMYPGIAAMALKNKHGWRDKFDIDQNITGNLDLKSLLADEKTTDSSST